MGHEDGVCPKCGYCPHCGRGQNQWPIYYYYPTYPTYLHPMYPMPVGRSFTITMDTISDGTATHSD